MRLPFPQDNTAFRYDGPGTPIRQPGLVPITIYADEDLTELADIRTPEDVAITGSLITIGHDGLIPDFLGPNDASSVLWALPVDGTSYPMVAKTDAYVDLRFDQVVGDASSPYDTLGGLADALNAKTVYQTLTDQRLGGQTTPYESQTKIYNDLPYDWHFVAVRAYLKTAATGASFLVRLHRISDASVIATASIPTAQHTAVWTDFTADPVVAPGDGVYFTVDQVGSSVAGSDLSVQWLVYSNVPVEG